MIIIVIAAVFGASTSSNQGTFVSLFDDFKRCTGVLDRGLHRETGPL